MSYRGVHFAITAEEYLKLRGFDSDADRLEYLQTAIEEEYFTQFPQMKHETDKAWDAIHRCLTDGSLGYANGQYPLNQVILGGEPLYFEDDYFISAKNPEQVVDIASAIQAVDQEQMRSRYFQLDESEYGMPLTEEDFSYTWEWLTGLKLFYDRAAREQRYVLFTADQ